MHQNAKKTNPLHIALFSFAAALCVLFPILLAILPALFAYLLLCGRPPQYFGALFLSALLIYLLAGFSGIYIFFTIALCSALLYFMAVKKLSYFDMALACAAFLTFSSYLMVSAADILDGNTPFYTMQSYVRALLDAAASSAVPELITDMQREAFLEAGQAIVSNLPIYMPAVLCALGAAYGLLNTALFARMAKKAGAPIKNMQPFSLWRLPKSFIMGAAVMCAGLMISMSLSISAQDAILYAVLSVLFLPFFVQGTAVYAFLLRMRNGTALMKAGMIFILIATLPMSAWVVASLGVMEQFMKLRARIFNKNGNTKG